MAISSFSGLSSGVQWRDLVDQVIAAQSVPVNRLKAQQTAIGNRKTAWGNFRSKVSALQTAAAGLADASRLRASSTSVTNRGAGPAPLIANASLTARPGAYRVDVLGLATAEKLGGSTFSSRSEAASQSGTLLVNGRSLSIVASDSLDQIAQRFNDLNTGTSPSGVSASVLETGGRFRLVLAAGSTGAGGMDLKDVSGSALRGLGIVDNALTRKHELATGASSDSFTSATTAIGSLLGLTGLGDSAVTIGGVGVTLNLQNQSLEQVATAINLASDAAGSTVEAAVVADSTGGATRYRLDITGSTSFTDPAGALETLGVLKATRTSEQRSVATDAFTTGGAPATPALASTKLLDLNSGLLLNDSLKLAGTRADGSTFQLSLSVGADTTVQNVLDTLNSASGYGADGGNVRPTAKASLSATGSIVVLDDVAGESSLGLSMSAVTGSDPARTLSTAAATAQGRSRVLTAASDALLRVDGTYVSRSRNEISDAVNGITLNLTNTGSVDITVAREVGSGVAAITSFINAYNELSAFTQEQLTPPPPGGTAKPLYGDSTLRSMQTSLRSTLRSTIQGGIAGSYTKLLDLGIQVDRYGKFNVDQAKLTDAVKNKPVDIERFFGTAGSSGDSLLSFGSATAKTAPGSYSVNITQPATRAQATGLDFGAYVMQGVDDTLEVTDRISGRKYSVALQAGMNATDLAAALNTQFGTATARKLESGTAITGDTSTLLTALETAGGSLGLLEGEKLVISGKSALGTAFTTDYTIGATSTLGNLIDAVQRQLGNDATVTLSGGKLQVTSRATGSSQLELNITRDSDPTAPFGVIGELEQGRPVSRITADVSAGAVRLTHADYGNAAGFTLGGTANLAQLGFDTTPRAGLDVAGTISGEAASGAGRILTATTGAASGLALSYAGAATASTTFTFSRGIGALVEAAAKALTEAQTGAIDSLTARLDERVQQLTTRADTLEQRLETRREQMVRQFTAMEKAMAKTQSQSAWLTSQMAQFEKKS